MATSARFGLSLRILAHLALAPASDAETMHTSATIATALGTNPVMVRRLFASLSKAGFLLQRKGPNGGARLKLAPKLVGLGDIYAAVTPTSPPTQDKAVDALLKRTRIRTPTKRQSPQRCASSPPETLSSPKTIQESSSCSFAITYSRNYVGVVTPPNPIE